MDWGFVKNRLRFSLDKWVVIMIPGKRSPDYYATRAKNVYIHHYRFLKYQSFPFIFLHVSVNDFRVYAVNWLTSSSFPLCNVTSNCPQYTLTKTLCQLLLCMCMFRSISQSYGLCDLFSSCLTVFFFDEVNLHSILIL